MEPDIVGGRIQKIMEIKNIKPEQLAKKLRITKRALDKKLTGKKEFNLSKIMQIKELFNFSLEVFTGIFFEKDFSFKEKQLSSFK